MAYDEVLAERIRDRLREVDGIAEKKMFGGLAFLDHGNMSVGVHADELIVRLSPQATDTALAQPGAHPFDLGPGGRPAKGWLLVNGEVLDDDVLDDWIAKARAYTATLPPKR